MNSLVIVILCFASAFGLVIFAILWNVNSVKWAHEPIAEKRLKYSHRWHRDNFMVRLFGFTGLFSGLILAEVAINWSGFIALLYANLAYTGWNLYYNHRFNHKWYYTGSRQSNSGSKLDSVFGKLTIGIQMALALLTILWIPLNLHKVLIYLYEAIAARWIDWLIAALLITLALVFARKIYRK